MERRYVALLRAITNVKMQPFREGMAGLGFSGVVSYGMSGNLLFGADNPDARALERIIAARFETAVCVRTRGELARIVAGDLFGSSILFLVRPPTTARRQAFLRLEFEEPRPVLRGKTVFFVHPARLRGKQAPLDFEKALGVQGTARSAQVVRRLLARMTEPVGRDDRTD